MLADIHWLQEFFQQDLARMNWASFLVTISSPSVVVYYLYVTRVTIAPTKTNPPLIIFPNTMLPFPIPATFLEMVPRWDTEIIQPFRRIE